MLSNPRVSTVAAIDPATLEDWEREAIDDFVRTAHANGDKAVTCRDVRSCGLFLRGEPAEVFGEDLPCLAVVCDDLGNWTALIRRPRQEPGARALLTVQFLGSEVV